MTKRLLIIILLPLFFTANAQAVRLVNSRGQEVMQPWNRWSTNMAVASWRGPLVLEINGSCGPYITGCAYLPRNPRIIVSGASRFTLYHELGHEFDRRYLKDGDRRVFISAIAREWGVTNQPWWGNGLTDFAEYFADDYAFCGLGDFSITRSHTCKLINLIGRREHAAPPERRIVATAALARTYTHRRCT